MKVKIRSIGLGLILTTTIIHQTKAEEYDTVLIDDFNDPKSKYNNQDLPRYGESYTMMDRGVQITDPSGSWTENIGTTKFSLTPNSVFCVELVYQHASIRRGFSNDRVPKLVYHQKEMDNRGDANKQVSIDMELGYGEQVVKIALKDMDGAEWEHGHAISIHGLMRITRIEIILDRPLMFNPSLLATNHGLPNVHKSRTIVLGKETLFDDAYVQIMEIPTFELHQELNIVFQNEFGGSMRWRLRQFFIRFWHALSKTKWALFTETPDGLLAIDLDSINDETDELVHRFRFVGLVVGMAIYHGCPLGGQFAPSFYKLLLGRQILLDDMEFIDLPFYKIFCAILETDMSRLGISIIFDDTPSTDGTLQLLTNGNRQVYILHTIKWKITTQFHAQIKSLRLGILEMITESRFKALKVPEMDVLVSGRTVVEVNDWKSQTDILGFSFEDPTIGWFWQVLELWDNDLRLKLLFMVTGSSRVPSTGMKGLFGGSRFTVKKSHSNRIDLHPKSECLCLPTCSSFKELQNLVTAFVTDKGTEQ